MVRYLSLGAPNRLFLEFSSDLSSASSLCRSFSRHLPQIQPRRRCYSLGQGQENRLIEAQSAYGLIDRPFQNLVDRSIHLANQTIQLVLNILPSPQLARPLPIRQLSHRTSQFTIRSYFPVPTPAKPPPSHPTVPAVPAAPDLPQ
jgi:hypothetical protein